MCSVFPELENALNFFFPFSFLLPSLLFYCSFFLFFCRLSCSDPVLSYSQTRLNLLFPLLKQEAWGGVSWARLRFSHSWRAFLTLQPQVWFGTVGLRNAQGGDSPCRGFDLRAPQKPAISSTLIPPNHGSFSLFSLYFCFFFLPPFSSIPTKTKKEKAGCPAFSSRQPSMNSLCFFT